MNDYGLSVWGNSNFVIENGEICVNSDSKPALIDMINQIRTKGIRGPILLRFPHLIKKQIVEIYSNFKRARKEFDYHCAFNAVYPLKVNQYPGFVKNLIDLGKPYKYGLEAGSKAELLLPIHHQY